MSPEAFVPSKFINLVDDSPGIDSVLGKNYKWYDNKFGYASLRRLNDTQIAALRVLNIPGLLVEQDKLYGNEVGYISSQCIKILQDAHPEVVSGSLTAYAKCKHPTIDGGFLLIRVKCNNVTRQGYRGEAISYNGNPGQGMDVECYEESPDNIAKFEIRGLPRDTERTTLTRLKQIGAAMDFDNGQLLIGSLKNYEIVEQSVFEAVVNEFNGK